MTAVWTLFALWVALALIASLLSVWLRVSTALTEICVGTAAQLILGTAFGATVLGSDEPWIKFLAGIGAIMNIPVSVCHQVSMMGQRPLPMTR